MRKVCFVTSELSPFSNGGIGVLLSNILHKYKETDYEFHILLAGDLEIDDASFTYIFPDVKLWRATDLVPERADPTLRPPKWAFTTHDWHYTSYQVMCALRQLSTQGVIFDLVEFPDWGGLAFCTSQEKLLGLFSDTLISIRLHSTDSILRAQQPATGGEKSANLSDLERKALSDADIIVAHLASVAEATRKHFGFRRDWLEKVKINTPPIPLESIGQAISFEVDTPLCFSSKIQALKRPDIFLKGALTFMGLHPEYRGEILFVAHPTEMDLKSALARRIPTDLVKRVHFIEAASNAERASISRSSISVFPSPFESFCLAAYEASLQGGLVALNSMNPAFSDDTVWRDNENCLTFTGTSISLAERLSLAWGERKEARWLPVELFPASRPYWMDIRKAHFPAVPLAKDFVKEPLVSVVIPYYNMGIYIRDTLESVLVSTYSNMEIILVDDASNDQHSKIVLDKIRQSERFQSIRVLSIPTNIGLSGARNFGVKEALGEYILTLDSDDLIHSNFIELGVNALRQNPDYSLVIPQTAFVSDSASTSEMTVIDYALFVGESVRAGCMVNRFSTATCLGKRDFFLEFPYDEFLDSYEDWDVYARAVRAGKRFIVTSDIYFYYRRRAGSMIAENTRARHVRNLSIIRAKHLLVNGSVTFDLNVLTDTESWHNKQIEHHETIGLAGQVERGGDVKDRYIEMLRKQIAHQDILLREANAKLTSVKEVVSSIKGKFESIHQADKSAINGDLVVRNVNQRSRLLLFPFASIYNNMTLKRQSRLLLESGKFDADWYLKNNPDVASSGMSAAEHFIRFGQYEGRPPRADWR